jgi:hypothetical protein
MNCAKNARLVIQRKSPAIRHNAYFVVPKNAPHSQGNGGGDCGFAAAAERHGGNVTT